MKILYSSFVLLATICNYSVKAQCPGNLYRDYVYSSYDLTSDIVYGNNLDKSGTALDLKLDIYEPTGDTVSERPLIIMTHGGNFLGGSKTGTDVLPMCQDFSKMGYVVASIDYRVGMNNFPFPGPDSADAAEAVMRGYFDAKAAVRYFKKNYAIGGNTYRIDTNLIFFDGVSAGAFMALHLAYLDKTSEMPTYIDTLQPGLGGGLDGLSGNPGYSSKVTAIINICGAIGDTAWMSAGDTPVMSFHGDNDQTVPYGSDVITLLGVYPLLMVHGSASVTAKANQVGIINCFETYEGQDHVPHVSNAFYYDTTLVISRNFLVHFICGDPLDCSYSNPIGISENNLSSSLTVYPNPASDKVTINFDGLLKNAKVQLFDGMGNLIIETVITNNQLTFVTSNLSKGLYFIQVVTNNGIATKKLIIQ